MGTASSIHHATNHTENDTEDRTTFGDRVEITRTLPVEDFGKDDAHKDDALETCASNDRINLKESSQVRSNQRNKPAPSRASSSIRSLVSSLYHPRSDTVERTRSENTSEAIDAAELKLQRVLQLKGNLEVENERLKREISSLRSNVSKWRNESTNARQDEKQALLRAENLEKELDRVKRQFKCYRDGKEKEIHNLIKKKHELENSLRHYSGGDRTRNAELCPLPERLLAPFDNDSNVENISLFRASGSLENPESKIPDCNTVFPLLPQVMKSLKPVRQKHTFKLVLSRDEEAKSDANFLKKTFFPKLLQLCAKNGKFFIVVECNTEIVDSDEQSYKSLQLGKCDMFIGMLGNAGNRKLLEEWKKSFQIISEKGRPLIYCIKDAKNSLNGGTELTHFIDLVSGYSKTKVSFYSEILKLVDENDEEVQSIINEHFEIMDDEHRQNQSISDEELISDCESSYQQLDVLHLSARPAIDDARFIKYYDQLNEYVSGAGPSPPLLVIGASGSGKTTLLAKWITSQLHAGENVVLYHFVETRTTSADPTRVIRRFASQLFGLVPCLCAMLHCDPVECEEYFPRLLETVPQQVNTNIVIIIDSVDKLQNAATSSCLSWLNDPLPATVRVVLSMTEGNLPAPWSSWPSVDVSPLTLEESSHVLVSRWCHPEIKIDSDQASKFLENFPNSAISSPLYVTMLAHELARSSDLDTSIKAYSSLKNIAELILFFLKLTEEQNGQLANEVLGFICCSRGGLAEAEIMSLVSLTWCEWAPLYNVLLLYRPILVEMNGLLTVCHEQVLDAIRAYLNEKGTLNSFRHRLVEYYFDKIKTRCISFSVIDQLPWLLEKLDEKEKLREFLSRTDVFEMFIQRSLYSELLGYWKYLNEDYSSFGNIYFEAIKKSEGDTPCLEVALLYETLGRFLKSIDVTRSLAMKCLERSLEMKELVVEPDDPWVGQTLHHLADLYVTLGNLESAESSYKQTLAINERSLGKDHPLVAKELESLAYVKKKQNNEKSHSELLRKAARIRRKSHMPSCSWGVNLDVSSIEVQSLGTGRTTPELAASLHNLGVLFMVQKKYQDAETLFMKSLDMREALLGNSDPAVAQSLESLASLYCVKKMYSEAIVYYEKSLNIKQQNMDANDPNLMSTMNRLAMAFRKDGKLDRSESMYRQVLTVLQQKHDAKDPVIATALHNLAVVNCEQKKLQEALQLFEQAVEIYEDALGSSHPKVAECLRNLAKVYLDMGNSVEASLHLRRSQMIQENDLTVTTISSQPSFAGVSSILDDSTLDLTAR